jgi:hypothetical protein
MHRPADPEAEYILVYDHPVWAESPGEVLVPRDTVVTVRDRANGSAALGVILGATHDLEFEVKGTGERHTTNYGYMFALNTPENRERLAEARRAREAWVLADRAMKAAFAKVEIVTGPFERSGG